MDFAALCQEQAAYCAFLLRRVVEPRRRAQIEREREDWLRLAYERQLWASFDASSPRAAAR